MHVHSSRSFQNAILLSTRLADNLLNVERPRHSSQLNNAGSSTDILRGELAAKQSDELSCQSTNQGAGEFDCF